MCAKLYDVIMRVIFSKRCYINIRPAINRYVAVSTSTEPLSETFRVITFFDTAQIERKLCVV